MARIKLPSFSEGGLLQRTLLYVATFVLGSVGFVAVASLVVVWAAKSVLPSRSATAPEDDSDNPAEVAAISPGKTGPGGKITRPKRGKAPTLAEDAPAEEAH